LKAVVVHNGNKHPSIPLAHAVHMKETYANFQGLLTKYVTKTTSGTNVLTWKLCQSWLGCKKVIENVVASYVNRTAERGTDITM